jgi:hypothetical protein
VYSDSDQAFSVYAMNNSVNLSGMLSRDLCRIAAASRMPFASTFSGLRARFAIASLVDFLRFDVDGALTK